MSSDFVLSYIVEHSKSQSLDFHLQAKDVFLLNSDHIIKVH